MKLLLACTSNDTKYISTLAQSFKHFSAVHPQAKPYGTFTEILMDCKRFGCTHVATTSLKTLKLFDRFLDGTKAENTGYVVSKQGISCVLLPDFSVVWSTNPGRFLIRHYLEKLAHPGRFLRTPTFTWEELHEGNHEQAYEFLRNCAIMSIDLETENASGLRTITSCSYTGLQTSGVCRTYVMDFRGHDPDAIMFRFTIMRKINGVSVPKILQNGMYDCLYFARFNRPLCAYLFDTYHLQHCLFPELKKELETIALMYIANVRFWKNESDGNLLEYNAKDTFYTLWAWLAMLHYIKRTRSQYALRNYQIEFPNVFPCHTCDLEGLAIDQEENRRLRAEQVGRLNRYQHSLEVLTGLPGINAKSPKQMSELLKAVGYNKAKGTDSKELAAFAEEHPLYERLAECITNIREAQKAISNYYDFEQWNERLYYHLDPAGTETGRLSSKASGFWCGSQIQNQPVYCKSQYIPDRGYVFGSCDNEQSESRCTAYIAQDLGLIRSVEESPDFHCANASLFFGIPFDQLYDTELGKVLNKGIRTLAKRVNHGANYNMGWFVLWQTMGTRNVYQAAHLLGLPTGWRPKQICTYLLDCFDRAYPRVRNEYQQEVIKEIEMTGRLVGETGWTRRTFLQPRKRKPDLNSAVAHKPQSLSVMQVNKGFYSVWRWQMETNSQHIRIKAQVHDDIFFQYPVGEDWVVKKVSDLMIQHTIEVHGRTLVIPNDPKGGATNWAQLKD